ncbi:MAG: glycosyltransferase family 4 protein [Planctomycetes bacterium]|nr:glycosyltransferase family 4 protein [Planctomycetota bacterium]
MRVLLDGRRLTRARQRGGLDAAWRLLVPALLRQAPNEVDFGLLTTSAYPWRTGMLPGIASAGASIHHHWASASALATLGRLGLRTEWLGPGKADLLHLSHPRWFLPTRARLVVSVQSLLHRDHPQLYRPKQVERLEKGLLGMTESACLWICASEGTREDLIRLYHVPRGRTVVVPPGTTPGFSEAAQDPAGIAQVRARMGLEQRPYFLFLGAIEPRKNLKNLVDAFELAVSRGLKADLVLAGPYGWQSQRIREACARRTRLQGRLHLPGYVATDDLPTLMAGACGFVHPARHEGTGMTAMEAMAAGTPVLCSNRGALPEVTAGAALLFEPNDPASIARTLQQTEGDHNLRARMREQGLARSADFTWEQSAAQTLEAYRFAMRLPT